MLFLVFTIQNLTIIPTTIILPLHIFLFHIKNLICNTQLLNAPNCNKLILTSSFGLVFTQFQLLHLFLQVQTQQNLVLNLY